MSWKRRVALGATVAALTGGLLVWTNLEAIVDWSMTPGHGFDAQTHPLPPNYANDAHWSALPTRDDSADRAPEGVEAIDVRRAQVDVFYIHPTSYVGASWNAPVDDVQLNADTDRVATGVQATVFNGCCAVYAPRYRQANGTAFYRPSLDGEQAMDLAYQDVRAAFAAFQARRDSTRWFVLAAHSQGSFHAERLLSELANEPSTLSRMVAAYLIGGVLTVEGLRERNPQVPVCARADDVGCVVAFQVRGPNFEPNRFELRGPDSRERVCVNPLSWSLDGEHAAASLNLGAVFLASSNPAPRPAFADARCSAGTLIVTELGAYERDLPSRILDRVLGAGNYHSIEMQLFFMNLRANVEARVAAAGRAPAPIP